MPVASLLLVLATVLQQPESDDIGLPDSLPADRTWELAAAYFQRVGESIWRKDADSAVKWEARARHRLPEPYLSALYQVAADFSGRFREAVDKRIGNDFRLESGVDLGFWDAKEILDSPPPLYNPSPDHHRKAGLFQRAAWVEGARGEYERALEAVKHLETVGNNDAWKRFAADLRIRIAELKECDDDPAVLAKLSANHPHQRLHSMTMTFGALKRLSVRPGPPGSPRRAQSFKAMAALLKGIEDRAGAQAMEDRVFKEVGASADDLAGILYARVHVNVSSGYPEPSPERIQAAIEGYRRILREYPTARIRKDVLRSLGDILFVAQQPAEARKSYEQLMDEESSTRRDIQNKIGQTYEAEQAWEKALEFYTQGAKPGVGNSSWCGTCMDQRELTSQARIARCLFHLGRDEEAMTLCREILFKSDGGTGGMRLEICWIAVESSIRQGKFKEFKRDLETTVRPKYQDSHIKGTLEYIDLLNRREAGDVAGLFGAILKKGVSNAWHQNRWKPEPFAIEALECIATMGDPAFDWLVQKATGNAFPDQMLALTAIAHFRHERALAFIRGDQWKIREGQAGFRQMLEKIHAGTARKRLFPQPALQKQ